MPDRQPHTQSRAETGQAAVNGPVDIASVEIDPSLPPGRRMRKFLEQIKNPYGFLCRNTPVRLSFNPDGQDLGALLAHYFISLKRG